MAELPEVRIAQPKDEPAIMAMCRRLYDENGLFSYNEERVRDCVRRCFTAKGTIVGLIGTDKIEACTCMEIASFYYTDDWHLEELWNYVLPEYRKSRNAEALIEFCKACAVRMQIPLVTGIVTNKQMAGKVRLYRRLFGTTAGAYFVYNSQWKAEPMEDHAPLRLRLKEYAKVCNELRLGKASNSELRKQITYLRDQVGPLLREAAEAISAEDHLWGTVTRTNGAATHGADG